MKSVIKKCMLTVEQRFLIQKGIYEGKKEYQEIKALLPETITMKHSPFLLYDLVNTHVARQIEENLHTQMKVFRRQAGFHPYIVLHDTVRNIFILVSKLPDNQYIPNPSIHRGEFAYSNGDRLLEMGVPYEEIYGDSVFQTSLPLGVENQPFGILVCYDGYKDVIYEGALRPDQEAWIYKEDISQIINIEVETLVPFDNYQQTDIPLQLKEQIEEEIVVKLKNT